MAELTIDIRPQGQSRVIIGVAGEIDMATAPNLRACLGDHAHCDVTLDFTDVKFLDAAGIHALVEGYNQLRDAGHRLRITGEQELVRRVLEITGFARILDGDED
jgi:anti-anti-sigma factor